MKAPYSSLLHKGRIRPAALTSKEQRLRIAEMLHAAQDFVAKVHRSIAKHGPNLAPTQDS